MAEERSDRLISWVSDPHHQWMRVRWCDPGAQPQLSLQLFRCRAGLSLGVASVLTLREHPVSAREMTGVSARPLLQIILVLRLRFPEVTHGLDFGDDLAVP